MDKGYYNNNKNAIHFYYSKKLYLVKKKYKKNLHNFHKS